jgi:hypothetical protein
MSSNTFALFLAALAIAAGLVFGKTLAGKVTTRI